MKLSSLKEQHEFAVGHALLDALGYLAEFLNHGVDGEEPDLLFQFGERRIGIEIATAYYDDNQARVEWQMARGALKPDSNGIVRLGFWESPDELIDARVQAELNDKCSKKYSGVDAAWLCIEQHAPLSDVAETCARASRMRVPSSHPFERIYLGLHAPAGDGGGFRVFPLYMAPFVNVTPA